MRPIPNTPILTAVAHNISRHRNLNDVADQISRGDETAFAERVAALHDSDRDAADVILWGLASCVVYRAARFQRYRPMSERVDEILTALWCVLNDLDPANVPSIDVVINRAVKRALRANRPSEDFPLEPGILTSINGRGCAGNDPTGDTVIYRNELARLGSYVASGGVSEQTWAALVAIRIHGDHSGQHGHASSIRSRLERATKDCRQQLAS